MNKMRFPLKYKTILLLVIIIAISSIVSVLMCRNLVRRIITQEYSNQAEDLAAVAANSIESDRTRRVRDRVMDIYRATDKRISDEDSDDPGYGDYIAKYQDIEHSVDYVILRDDLRTIQDRSSATYVYIYYVDPETEAMVYICDAAYGNEISHPGSFDPLDDDNRTLLTKPEAGLSPMESNTKEYGWLISAGQPIYDRGEIVAFAGVDYSMDVINSIVRNYIVTAAVAMVFLCVILCLVAIAIVDRTIVQPINTLSAAAQTYQSDDNARIHFNFADLDIKTGDEIEVLADSMSRMEHDINTHITNLLQTTEELNTSRKRAGELEALANRDALTGVGSKRAYNIKVEKINRDIELGTADFGFAIIDLNGLKNINDTYGHKTGDLAIKNICDIAQSVFESPIYRIGGDEFVVILEGEELKRADIKIDEFYDAVAKKHDNERLEPWERVDAAVGYSRYIPDRDKQAVYAFNRADESMYQHKYQMKHRS